MSVPTVWQGRFIYLTCKLTRYAAKDFRCSICPLKTIYKRMFLYKCPLYDHSWPFFHHMCDIFHKTEVLTIILRCLMGINIDWVKSYGLKCNLRHRASSVRYTVYTHMSKKWPGMVVKRTFIKGHSFICIQTLPKV